jgi:hypothetical protein
MGEKHTERTRVRRTLAGTAPSTVAVLVLLGVTLLALLLGTSAGGTVIVAVLSGATLGCIFVLHARANRPRTFVASLVLLPAAGLLCLAPVVGLSSMGIVGLLLAASGIAVGIGVLTVSVPPETIGTAELFRTLGSTFQGILLAMALGTASFVLTAIGRLFGPASGGALLPGLVGLTAGLGNLFSAPPYPGPHPELLGVLLAVLTWLVRTTIRTLPWEPFVAQHRRDDVAARIARVTDPLAYGYWLAAGLVGSKVLLGAVQVLSVPGTGVLAVLLSIVAGPSLLREFLVANVVGFATLRTVAALARLLLKRIPHRFQGFVAQNAGVVFVWVCLVTGLVQRSTVAPLVTALPRVIGGPLGVIIDAIGFATVVLSVLTVLYGVVLVVTFGTTIIVNGRFVGASTVGPALASAGTIGTAGALALGPTSPLLVFAVTAIGLAIWDIGAYGIAVRRELGETTTWRSEGLHVGGTLVVAGVTTLVTRGLLTVVRSLAIEGATAVGVVAALGLAGVVLLAPYIRS